MSDELNKGELCRGCQHISVDGLVSDDGISHILLPGRCQFCKLLFQTLKSCGCKSEWEVEGDGCEQKVWRAEMQDENLTLGPRWTNPNWRKALWDGPKPEGHVRLWARPIEQARQLFDELQGKPDSERGSRLELRLEGVTVCYGRPRVMDNMSWPASLHGIEHGSNALQEAISPLHGDGVYMKHLEHNKTHVCAGSLVFTASPTDPAAALLRYRPPAAQANSAEDYELVKSWMENCAKNHHDCNHSDSLETQFPSRLIDVDGSEGEHLIKLVDIAEKPSTTTTPPSYVALSYCWGSAASAPNSGTDTKYQTTSENLDQRRNGFSELNLPPTIRDAVTITRRLGVKYLWVDALCILQGKNSEAVDDWTTESTRMQQIYGGALVTIAAASAASAYDGIFNLYTPQQEIDPVELTLSSSKHQLGQGGVFATQLIPSDARDMPLYHRGWTLQERILSPRVLTYTHDQLLWECQTTTLTQRGTPMESFHTARLPDNCPADELHDRWQVIVTDYSARDLSMMTDKLPAISGLAQAFQAQMGGQDYLAGLWRGSLLDDILWIHKPVDIGRRAEQSRPEKYRAPSWSWASVDGNIRWPMALWNRDGPYAAEVIDAWTTSKGCSQLSQVEDGRLVLKGPLRRLGDLTENYGWLTETVGSHSDNIRLELDALTKSSVLQAIGGRQDVFVFRIKADQALLIQLVRGEVGDTVERPTFKRLGLASNWSWPTESSKEDNTFQERIIEII